MTLRGNFGDPRTERDVLSAKRFNFLALIVMILAILAGFLITLQLLSKQRQLEEKTQQLADSTANLRHMRRELVAAQHALAVRDSLTYRQLHDLSSSVENHDYHDALEQARTIQTAMARSDSAGLTVVHFYAWRPQDGSMARIHQYFQDPAYVLSSEETLQDLPNWMGQISAVYFYDRKVQQKARTIAQQLSKLTGTRFYALPGQPSDAPDYDEHNWVRINYLGETPESAK